MAALTLVQPGDILIKFNQHALGKESVENLSRLLQSATPPFSMTFFNPFAVDRDVAAAAELPYRCTHSLQLKLLQPGWCCCSCS